MVMLTLSWIKARLPIARRGSSTGERFRHSARGAERRGEIPEVDVVVLAKGVKNDPSPRDAQDDTRQVMAKLM
jgi:hypothetical protein